jgi:glycosyltransferase involved in cell wall biosynthesis
MKIKKEISLVVPVYNEQEIIAETVKVFLSDLEEVCDDHELIIVDDASTDDTAKILFGLEKKFSAKLRVLRNEHNLGGGTSLLKGFKQARFDHIGTNFADRPFDLKELKNIFPLFEQGNDFVVVCRTDRSANSLYRKITSLVNYHLIRSLFQVDVGDFQFVQVYKRPVLENLKIGAKRTFVPAEIIIKALHKGWSMAEYKAKFHKRTKGRAKCGHPRIIITALKDIFTFWIKLKQASPVN